MTNEGCIKRTSGGKGNLGKFIDREPRICAAGIATKQADVVVPEAFQQYLLVDEVNALLSDAIIPPKPPPPLAPLVYPIERDQRNCGFADSELAKLINPPKLTKFQKLVEELKETPYASYWKKPLGKTPDPTHMFPDGFDINGTTYGKKNPKEVSVYEIVFPTKPLPDKTPPSKEAGAQTFRNYCQPPFDPDLTYGYRTKIDKRGIYVKCALTDDRVIDGRGNVIVCNSVKADFIESRVPQIGQPLAPYDNISLMPVGFAFGKLEKPTNIAESLLQCDINPERKCFLTCLGHLNTVRRNISHQLPPSFFKTMLLTLKYHDKEKTGWIQKDVAYNYCFTKHIRFDPGLIEPLLKVWNAFDGENVKYRIFGLILNYSQPLPDLPKVEDVPQKFLDFRTTYREMVKPGQEADPRPMAGIPSGRYFDKDYPVVVEGQCEAHKSCLSMETDVFACISPSIMTLANVSHRDMYAQREPEVVRKVFEAAGYKFTDDSFQKIWKEAQKYHSQGLVCYETFRKVLQENPDDSCGANVNKNTLVNNRCNKKLI